jgi:hypothetical protein
MYFVPEGQHNSSQVRSAWVLIKKRPRPGGQSKSMSAKSQGPGNLTRALAREISRLVPVELLLKASPRWPVPLSWESSQVVQGFIVKPAAHRQPFLLLQS